MRLLSRITLPSVAVVLMLIFLVQADLGKRKAFSIPLAFMTHQLDADGNIIEVFVTFDNSPEGWAISPGDDRYVKDTRKLRMDHTYREMPRQEYLLSPFEADVLNRVCETLVETLEDFEKDLKNERWDKCLYLDSYFPVFMKNFYYLFCAARNSLQALPAITNIADTLFENSIQSEISDKRIDVWRGNPNHLMKLRIAAKELLYQTEIYRKKELANPKRDAWEDNSKPFIETYQLFVRLYFNLPAK